MFPTNLPGTLKLTAKAPENGWLEDDCFLLGKRPIFRGELLVNLTNVFQNGWRLPTN